MLDRLKKYNFWGNDNIPLGYQRTSYTDKLLRYSDNSLIKVLVGQRRSGKSFILRQLAHALISQKGVDPRNTLFVNVEFFDSQMKRSVQTLEALYAEYRSTIATSGKVYLFIDEIQNLQGWELFVNARSQDFTDQCEVFITGSNSHLLAGELASMLSGRYVKFDVFPYSFAEYQQINALSPSYESYMAYLNDGGLPELINLPDYDMKVNYVSSLRDTVMLRDIVARFKVKDVQLLADIFTFLVNNASSVISIKNIVNYFASQHRKTNYETVSTYISYLESAFLVHKAPRFNIRGKEILSGTAKYYINDLSFRNYLYRGFGFGDGYRLENALYIELRRRGYDVYVGANADKEVDFVCLNADETLYVQATLELNSPSTLEREYSALLSIPDHYRKYVVSLDRHPQPSALGIENVRAWEF